MERAVAEVIRGTSGTLRVTTNGYITRDVFNHRDDAENFYLVGSMGMAGPIGLGIAAAASPRRVVVIDGDGSFAMNPGILPVIGQQRLDILHIVLDNGIHESTGGQEVVRLDDPCGMALSCGYSSARRLTSGEVIASSCQTVGPALVWIECEPRVAPSGKRVTHTPAEIVDRFRRTLEEGMQ
ncbi:thiamine pyrophosphate-dependent enzyme [Nocardiopsis rhodophaea]|uniref:thiamine pyrophosphate-dependent enzyme n=1 Tax=Nocardiopsis rhodophaea TaxID=280238 RepID=UPI0031D4C7F0